MSLPPLPEPLRAMDWQHAMYTAEQMREYARAAVAAEREDVMEMWYCESRHVVLRLGQTYRFKAKDDCESCQQMKREHDEAYGARGDA